MSHSKPLKVMMLCCFWCIAKHKHSFKMKLFIFLMNLISLITTQNDDETALQSSTISPSASSPQAQPSAKNPPGWERFANLKMDDELTDDFEPVKHAYRKSAKSPAVGGKSGLKYGGLFGLHLCTFRPCDCFIGSCFAYCAWHWCYQAQDQGNQRFYLPCDTSLDPWQCPDFDHPCIKFC